MSKYWSPSIRDIEPYVPGEQPKGGAVIKLNTNENPYPPSPRVLESIQGLPVDQLRLYPDPDASALRQAIANNLDVESKNVFVGNGSDEVLGLSFMAFFRQVWPILYPNYTYSFYPVYCNLFGIEYRTVPLGEDFSINIEDYETANGGVVIANPNAPTGMALSLDKIEQLLSFNRESVVIVDEAYVDFGAESAVSLIDRYENLLVVQTLSKSRSLAGLRVGYALGSEVLIDGLERVKNSFNSYPLDTLAINAAVAAIEDKEYFEQTRNAIVESRTWLTDELQQLGFEVLPSKANFVFVSHLEKDSETLYQQLRQQGILVRYFDKPVIDRYLRITVGTTDEIKALVDALKPLLES
ncbi:histidinol-phosphate transaminase [Motiliproteus sp. MSK22-1]|uniref:histidinol-phosphate transaminase n=1 Tax=Motiliproteus sp. MSK22-1 TaxID=1897630 RepID=UPI0009770754|nr:histidinol-phosphate transaminase [Motiliproteus sp. MSK22-1]OMH34030.1 histidinol-phosphate transaminase [Motiliproteus sp. MSK22-1]